MRCHPLPAISSRSSRLRLSLSSPPCNSRSAAVYLPSLTVELVTQCLNQGLLKSGTDIVFSVSVLGIEGSSRNMRNIRDHWKLRTSWHLVTTPKHLRPEHRSNLAQRRLGEADLVYFLDIKTVPRDLSRKLQKPRRDGKIYKDTHK